MIPSYDDIGWPTPTSQFQQKVASLTRLLCEAYSLIENKDNASEELVTWHSDYSRFAKNYAIYAAKKEERKQLAAEVIARLSAEELDALKEEWS